MTDGPFQQDGDVLRLSRITLGLPLGIIFVLASGIVLTVDLWSGDASIGAEIEKLLPFYDTAARVLLSLGIAIALYWKKTFLIHRDATVEIIRHFVFFQSRRHYRDEEAFGLTVYELEIPDPETPTEIYAIELLLMDGERIRLARFGTLQELHDCRRFIEKFTGKEIARKKVLDPLHGGPL